MNLVIQYYDTHPINEDQILQTLQKKGIPLDMLTEEILKDYDQDHYGGVEAVDILAQKAGIQVSRGDLPGRPYVLDVCSGMGGPARYLAHRYGCRVVGLDFTESRYHGAIRLTKLVRLDHLVKFKLGNALDMPFSTTTFDIAIGQEA
ncbi:MAG: methyltransferase domain-containing protein, partial [Nitrospira sp.]|nr:methyltransferase domain-containing protein [Nitrospira sp.]